MELLHDNSNSTLSPRTTNPLTSASTIFPPSPHPSDGSDSDTNAYITNDEGVSENSSATDLSTPEPLISALVDDFGIYDLEEDEWSVECIKIFGAMSFGDWIGRHPVTGKCTAVLTDEFLNDDFNASCTDRWPQWSDFGGDEGDEGQFVPVNLFPISRPKPLLQFIRRTFGNQEEFEEFIYECLRTNIGFLEDASTMYTLLHQRFVFTKQGMVQLEGRLLEGERMFGECPRTFCGGQFLLPCGKHNEPGKESIVGVLSGV